MMMLRQRCEVVQPAPVPPGAFEDRDDLPVLGTAVAGNASILVTGDKRLLDLESYNGVAILSPRAFHERLP
jgi:predicted nucleic acid-binding protein